MPDLIDLTIRRTGDFTVRWSGSNATQCGARGTKTLLYEVQIDGQSDRLTPEGFIIDNQVLHAYFAETYKDVQDFVSCERIAMRACEDFRLLLEGRANRIQVSVGGSSAAMLTARWHRAA